MVALDLGGLGIVLAAKVEADEHNHDNHAERKGGDMGPIHSASVGRAVVRIKAAA